MADSHSLPRLLVAGLAGDSGKTIFSLGLLLAARVRSLPGAAFKKGPDYIDAAWLSWAAGIPTRNLDTHLMGFRNAEHSFLRYALPGGLNIIEGNRGLYDGMDADGTHSSAVLAKLLKAPVILVVNAAKVTRTAAALVLGCQQLDPEVDIAGVILNRVAGRRHESVLRAAIESACGIPVLGALPRAEERAVLPERHLGLVTPDEHPRIDKLASSLHELVVRNVEFDHIVSIASKAAPLRVELPAARSPLNGQGLKIGYVRDSAFNFYYPENLEALAASGARLVPLSALSSAELPRDLDALYIGGGFPETHGAAISSNRCFLAGLKNAASGGLPIYAECGGLMLLSSAVVWRGDTYPMAGVFPFAVEMCGAPQGHGYVELVVDRPNPFFSPGTIIKGHEFHYSRVLPGGRLPQTACQVQRGTGAYDGRDGIILDNVWASYAHVHALGTPEWAQGLLQAAAARPH